MIWSANSLFFEHPDLYGISFDSRTVKPGDLFIALSGAHFDGHDFVLQAFKNGAVCALVERKVSSNNIVVPSCLDAFLQIARLRRSLFNGKVIAITGSVGKSTFRSSLVKSLRSSFLVDSPIKNYNTLLGLASFFSQFDLLSDFLVVELGIESPGDMHSVASLSLPHYSLLTNISSAHAYSLGSLFFILREKSLIFHHTSECAFFLRDLWYSPFLFDLMRDLSLPFSSFSLDSDSRGTFFNAAHSLFSFLELSLPFSVSEIPGRRDIFSFSYLGFHYSVIDSSYNANLASMIEELRYFSSFSSTSKKIAILGDMWGYSVRHHEFLSLYTGSFQCWLVGEKMFYLSLILPDVLFFSSLDALLQYLRFFLFYSSYDCDFLIKASNCMQFSQVIDVFREFVQ